MPISWSRFAVALVAFMRHLVLGRTLEMSDPTMPQANLIAGGEIGAHASIDTDPGYSLKRSILLGGLGSRQRGRVGP